MEFKSKQWFGASVRSDGEHIMVRTSAGDIYDPDRFLYLLTNILMMSEMSECFHHGDMN